MARLSTREDDAALDAVQDTMPRMVRRTVSKRSISALRAHLQEYAPDDRAESFGSSGD